MLKRILRIIALVFVGLIAIYIVLVITAQPAPNHPFFEKADILVIAHQGGDGLRPGNTLAAFQHAATLGADVLEMDIHSTQDGILVVIHDDTVDRTTNGSGRVQEYTFEQLQTLDAGYDWTPSLAEEDSQKDQPYRGQGIRIPSLEEIIQAFPDMRMNIEIKQKTPSIVASLCELLRRYDMTNRVLVASFHPETIGEFRRTCPEIATSAVEPEIRLFYALNLIGLTRIYSPSAYAFQVPEYASGLQVITPSFVESAQQRNVDVHPWTINDREQMERMIKLGVDGIITDYPDVLLALLGRGD